MMEIRRANENIEDDFSTIDVAIEGAIGFLRSWRLSLLVVLITASRFAVFGILLTGHGTRLPV